MGMLYNRLFIVLNEEDMDSTYYHIAMMMLKCLNRLSDMSIIEIADYCSVSKSTISKFIRHIGYEDYSEFRYAAVCSYNKYHYDFSFSQDVMQFIDRHGYDSYILTIQNDILSTYSTLQWDKIHQLVEDLDHYEKVAAFGLLFSETAAMDLQTKLAYHHKFIFTHLNDLKQDRFIENATSNTLIIIFSDSGEFLNKYQNIEDFSNKRVFQKTKAKIVVITSCQDIENDERIDYTITYQKTNDLCTHRMIYGIITDIIAYEYYQYMQKKK